MARPTTVEEFLVEIDTLIKLPFGGIGICVSCGGRYPLNFKGLTENHCSACEEEIFYNSCTQAVRTVMNENLTGV